MSLDPRCDHYHSVGQPFGLEQQHAVAPSLFARLHILPVKLTGPFGSVFFLGALPSLQPDRLKLEQSQLDRSINNERH